MDMDALVCRLDLSAARNSCRASSRNSRAMAVRGARSRCGVFSGRGSRDTSIACTISSNCSPRGRLAMATPQLRSQTLERTQLQLLYGPFAFAQPLRDFPDASLVDEALVNDALLSFRKLAYQSEQPRTVFDGAHVEMHARIGEIVGHGMFASRSLRAIDDGVRCDPQ